MGANVASWGMGTGRGKGREKGGGDGIRTEKPPYRSSTHLFAHGLMSAVSENNDVMTCRPAVSYHQAEMAMPMPTTATRGPQLSVAQKANTTSLGQCCKWELPGKKQNKNPE